MHKDTTLTPGSTMAVVGFGRAGQAICRYLTACGVHVLVSDLRRLDKLSGTERALLESCGADFEGGGHSGSFLSAAEKIIVSPGVDYLHPALEQARRQGIEIIGELGLAADMFLAPVIAVTGTNGKTTVTEMIGSLLRDGGKRVFVGGNIGTPIGEYLLADEEFDLIVLEVSSFQLELCGDFVPRVGVLLNITPDHLDRHKTLDGYAAAKLRIFQGGADRILRVAGGDDPLCRHYLDLSDRKHFALFGFDECYAAAVRLTFQTDLKGAAQIILTGNGVKHSFDLTGSRLANLSGLLNSAAALLAVSPFALDPQVMEQTLRRFEPGRHRLQRVGVVGGVVYIDDSKATNTGAVINAICQVGGRQVLIAGGRDKGDDYRLLRKPVADHVKRLILIGEAAGEIGRALSDLAPVDYPASLEEAVMLAAAAAEPGDAVLLSPACASFDMFDNYQQRGICFGNAVQRLAERLPDGVIG